MRLAVVAASLAFASPAIAGSSHRATLLVGRTRSASHARALSGRSVSGNVYVFVKGARAPVVARFFLDHRPGVRVHALGSAKARRGTLAPLLLEAGALTVGRHTLWATVTLAHKRSLVISARFSVRSAGGSKTTGVQLIDAALAAHKLSLGKALLYRFYTVWGDSRLPSQYAASSPGNDADLWYDASYAILTHQVRGAEAKALEPYIARPSDPASVLNGPTGQVKAARARASRKGGSTAVATCEQWSSVGDGAARVWAKDSGPAETKLETTELAVVDAALGAERGEIGSPISDAGGGGCSNPDGAVDVYLVSGSDYGPRGTRPVLEDALGYTSPWHFTDATYTKCSSYVLLPLRDTEAQLVVATYHEIFHVLANTHACSEIVHHSWFNEAAATWAGAYFAPASDDPISNSQALANYGDYQGTVRSLNDYGDDPESYDAYEDFVWPMFMHQEGVSMGSAFDSISNASSESELVDDLNGVFPFASHFADFAVRDLNMPYDGTSFQDPPDGLALPQTQPTSRSEGTVTLDDTGGSDQSEAITTPEDLDFRYETFTIPSNIRYVKLDFSQLPSDIHLDALETVSGDTTLQRQSLSDRTLEFCRDDQGQDISQVVIVLSNPSLTTEAQNPDAQFSYKTDSSCSGYHLTGTLNFSVSGVSSTDDPFSGSFSGSVTIDEHVEPASDEYDDDSTATFGGSYSGTLLDDTTHDVIDSYSATFPTATTGADDSPLFALWSFDSSSPSVQVSVILSADGTRTDDVTGNMGSGGCTFAPGVTTVPDESADWLSNTYTLALPPAGGTTTVPVDDDSPVFIGDGGCFEQYGTVQFTGQLQVSDAGPSGG